VIATSERGRLAAAPFAALLLVWLLGGCMPLVTHGPRVQEGLWTGSTGSFRLGTLLEGEVEALGREFAVRPPNGFFARYGWRPEESGPPGLSLGVHLPFAIPLSAVYPEVDVYAQMTPHDSPGAAGAGLLASPGYLMPYAQTGGQLSARSEWYTTQGLTVSGYAGGAPRAVIWAPALSLRRSRLEQTALHRRQFATHYFVQAGVGREWVPREGTGDGTRPVRFLLLGVTTEASGLPRLPRLGIPGL
jgi:hypothetical protein